MWHANRPRVPSGNARRCDQRLSLCYACGGGGSGGGGVRLWKRPMNSIAIGASGVSTKSVNVCASAAHGPVEHCAAVIGWLQPPGSGALVGWRMPPVIGPVLAHSGLGLGRNPWTKPASNRTAVRRRSITTDVTRTESNRSSIRYRLNGPTRPPESFSGKPVVCGLVAAGCPAVYMNLCPRNSIHA
jgi:hypothetical protein